MILSHHGVSPRIHETTFIAPSADVIGEVEIGECSSVWFQAVVRGDVNSIRIGKRTNIQDQCVLHVTRKGQRAAPLSIGDECTVGHQATLHGCTVGNRVLVGMGALILDHAEIGDECMVGAGALVTSGMKVPPGSLVLGMPAKVVRPLKREEIAFLAKSAANYVEDIAQYRALPTGKETNREKHG